MTDYQSELREMIIKYNDRLADFSGLAESLAATGELDELLIESHISSYDSAIELRTLCRLYNSWFPGDPAMEEVERHCTAGLKMLRIIQVNYEMRKPRE